MTEAPEPPSRPEPPAVTSHGGEPTMGQNSQPHVSSYVQTTPDVPYGTQPYYAPRVPTFGAPMAASTVMPKHNRSAPDYHSSAHGTRPYAPPAYGEYAPHPHHQVLNISAEYRNFSELPRRPGHGASCAATVLHTMRRWNISFSVRRGQDVEAFLARISEGRALFPVSDADLIRCLPLFLTGVTLQWFRNDQGRWTTWQTFQAACRLCFRDPDYQYALREEIMCRTQGPDEPVADFLTHLRGLFAHLGPP